MVGDLVIKPSTCVFKAHTTHPMFEAETMFFFLLSIVSCLVVKSRLRAQLLSFWLQYSLSLSLTTIIGQGTCKLWLLRSIINKQPLYLDIIQLWLPINDVPPTYWGFPGIAAGATPSGSHLCPCCELQMSIWIIWLDGDVRNDVIVFAFIRVYPGHFHSAGVMYALLVVLGCWFLATVVKHL